MIEVLTNNNTFFTTVEGKQPYKHKYTTPISKLTYADTVYNSLSRGIDAVWKVCDYYGAYSTSYAGTVPFIKFYYGNSQPETLLDEPYNKQWSVTYSFNFVAPQSGLYRFYFGGSGEISSFTAGSYSTSLGTMGMHDTDYLKTPEIYLFNNILVPISITYKNLTDRESGLVVLWQTNTDITPEKVVLSGAVCLPIEEVEFPTFSDIPLYSKIKYTERDEGSRTLQFEIPFISSTDAYNYSGYYYDESSDSFIEKSSKFQIKPYRMIRYYSGYRNENGVDELVLRFTGQIRSFNNNYSNTGEDIVSIECSDYTIFTKDAVNLESPTPIDYWQVGYLNKVPGRVNGEVKPKCFDGWEIHKAYEVLLTNSYIDPYTFYQKKNYRDFDNVSTSGAYFIESLSNDVSVYFPIQKEYGIPTTGEADNPGTSDDEYAYTASTGEYYQDVINKLLQSWYIKWGMSPEGYPYLRHINSPYSNVASTGFGYTAYHNVVSPSAFKGHYIETSTVGAIASCDAVGKKFILMMGAGPTCGEAKVSIYHDTTLLSTARYDLYHSTAHFYYDGALKSSNLNVSQLNIVYGLQYDQYHIVVENIDAVSRIEGLLSFSEDYDVPYQTYYTGPTAQANIVSLNVSKDFQDQRTDCVVLGRRTGTLIKIDSDGNEVVVNPNNQTSVYLQSGSRDLNAVYKSTSYNYVGRPRNTVIVDPSITSQQQADFISFNVVSEYGNVAKQASFSMQGNPLIEVNDCVAVVDDYKNGIVATDYKWVTQVEETFDDTYLTKIETTPIKPVESYWERPKVDITTFDGHYIKNFKVLNVGFWGRAVSGLSLVSTSISVYFPDTYNSYVQDLIPYFGYFRIGAEICQYDGYSIASSPNRIVLHNLVRGLGNKHDDSYIMSHSPLRDVVIANMPYSKGQVQPTVVFDLLEDADVEIAIENYNYSSGQSWNSKPLNLNIGNYKVDALTNPSLTPTLGNNNYTFLKAGRHTQFSWGGFDRVGKYNDSIKSSEEGSLLNTQYYARENYSVSDIANNIDMKYSTGFGIFRVVVKVKPQSSDQEFIYYSNASTSNSYLSGVGGETGCIKQILTEPGCLNLRFSTSGFYYVKPNYGYNTRTHDSNGNLIGGILRYDRSDLSNWSTVSAGPGLYVATNYPYCKVGSTAWPSFILNNSNQNEDNIPQGLKFYVEDYSQNKNSDIQRNWIGGSFTFRIVQMGVYQRTYNGETSHYAFPIIITDGALESDFVTTGKHYYIDIRNILIDKQGGFIPTEWKNLFLSNISEPGNDLYITNYVFFNNRVVDFSGRKISQPRTYKPHNEPNEVFKVFDYETYGYINSRESNVVPLLARTSNIGLSSYKVGGLPYYMGTSTVNCGWYEFAGDNTHDSDYWNYQYYYPNPLTNVKELGTKPLSFHKNLRHEIKPLLLSPTYSMSREFGISYSTSMPFHRSNYATWIDESDCKRIAFFEALPGGVWSRFMTLVNLQPDNMFVPNLWVHYERRDFGL